MTISQSLSLTFFDDANSERLLRELQQLSGDAAVVYGTSPLGVVSANVRKATQLQPSPATRELVRRRLCEVRDDIEQSFSLRLGDPEEPQFLRYDVGDYFVAHQDGNTPLIRDASHSRRVSVVVFVNAQSDDAHDDTYSGGSLLLYGTFPDRSAVEAIPGLLVAFRSETTHEVTPLTRGRRFTIVTWFSSREEVVAEDAPSQAARPLSPRDLATLPRIIDFIRSIGIEVEEGLMHRRTLVPGVDVQRGGLLVEASRLSMPADLLHEAAHIALTPSSRRHLVDGTMDGTPAEELSAIAWTWAAATVLELDPEDVFHQDVISGNGPTLLENFRARRFVGVPMLQHLGLTIDERHASERGVAPYPHMLRWLRD